MTHISGHIDEEASSFGVLKPVKINYTAKGTISSLAAVSFPILYVPPKNSSLNKRKLNNGEKLEEKHLVGFHPFVVPWGDGSKFLIIAGDVVDWKTHQDAEGKVRAKLGKASFNSYRGSLEVEGIAMEQLGDITGSRVIREAIAADSSPDIRHVLDCAVDYMQSSSFTRAYFRFGKVQSTNQVIEWIKDNGIEFKDLFSSKLFEYYKKLIGDKR